MRHESSSGSGNQEKGPFRKGTMYRLGEWQKVGPDAKGIGGLNKKCVNLRNVRICAIFHFTRNNAISGLFTVPSGIGKGIKNYTMMQ
jgi:hypothetical protein